ncbi:hypothetical protein P5673_021730 [Acropora cervicornis]|uniref:Uncharacterized protein n=1 Tax=Acropora cervicornis TaxID=6130 RepID=A0AAD9Q7T2_ACRCE|nr:hypothetical protein P5673_021730 [Acropora cervicornis]
MLGRIFSVNKGTRVFSRHFREEDLQRNLNGKISLRTGAVPSIFARKRSSPCKRAPPTPRIPATTLAKKKASEASEAVDSSTECCEIVSAVLIKIECLSTHAYGDLLFCYSFTTLNRRRGGTVSSKGLSSRHLKPNLVPRGCDPFGQQQG